MNKYAVFVIVLWACFAAGQSVESLDSDESAWGIFEGVKETFAEILDIFWTQGYELVSSAPQTSEYDEKREKLIKASKANYFTHDVKELTSEEKAVEEALFKLRSEIVQGDHSPILLPFYEGKKIIETSKVKKALENMPKGAHLHLHVSAAVPLRVLLDFTYEDIVYFNPDAKKLLASAEGPAGPGYIKWNELRKNWTKEGTFDEYLKDLILLSPEDIVTKESTIIWKNFQPKFSAVSGLFNYPPFLKRSLVELGKVAIQEKVNVLELRKSIGGLFDGNIVKELDLYQEAFDELKKIESTFEMRLIVTAPKVSGHDPIVAQLNNYVFAKKYYDFVTGFDLVNEEDATEPIYYYKDLILKAREEDANK